MVTLPDEDVPVRRLVVHTTDFDVSVRALQEGFQRALDTTPMRYLREVRLRRVREDLFAATPDVATVGAIVHRWGILNQGRFAGAYRKRFGEAPSETLRRQPTIVS
jgi:transcriptional regulator GlxA family with amidase domain